MKPDSNNRILIIDDNVAIHEDFIKVLSPADSNSSKLQELNEALFGSKCRSKATLNFSIDSAYQGEAGYNLVIKALKEDRPYAMAFVDILMPPGWDGIQTIKQIWKADPDIQIAICTAYADYSWDDIINELGLTDRLLILKKPFDNLEVRQMAYCLVKKWNLNQMAGHQIDLLSGSLKDKCEETQGSINELSNRSKV